MYVEDYLERFLLIKENVKKLTNIHKPSKCPANNTK